MNKYLVISFVFFVSSLSFCSSSNTFRVTNTKKFPTETIELKRSENDSNNFYTLWNGIELDIEYSFSHKSFNLLSVLAMLQKKSQESFFLAEAKSIFVKIDPNGLATCMVSTYDHDRGTVFSERL
jgi:hypothetical protein